MSYTKLSSMDYSSAMDEKLALRQYYAPRPSAPCTAGHFYFVELDCDYAPFATSAGLESEWDLAVARPDVSSMAPGSFYLCQMAVRSKTAPRGRTTVYANGMSKDGKPAIKAAEGFTTIWRHEDAASGRAWSVLRPTCSDPAYEPLGDFFQERDGQLEAEKGRIGLVHRSLLGEGQYASFIWNDRGSDARDSIALWGLEAPGMTGVNAFSTAADAELRPFRAGPSFFKSDAPAAKRLLNGYEMPRRPEQPLGVMNPKGVIAASKGWVGGLAKSLRTIFCL